MRQYVGEIAEDSDKTELYGPAVRLMYEWLADCGLRDIALMSAELESQRSSEPRTRTIENITDEARTLGEITIGRASEYGEV